MTEDTKPQFIKEVKSVERDVQIDRVDGRKIGRKLVGNDKLFSPQGAIDPGTVTQTMMANSSIGKAQLRYEQVSVVISGASTSGTAIVTTGSIPIGWFLSAFTTPAASYVQLAVSGTTLTATLSTAPGGGNSVTIQIILLKT